MAYLRGREAKKRTERRRIVIIISVALVILAVAIARGWLTPVTGAVGRALSPIQRVVYSIGSGLFRTTSKIHKIPELASANEELEARILELEAETNERDVLIQENERLRNELGLLPREEFDLLGAEIIGFGSVSNQAVRIINRGSTDGLKKGDPVIVGKSVLIGKVIETREQTATIVLLTSEESSINITIANKEILGIVRGDHDVGLLLDLIPQQDELNIGDQIVTSGVGNDFPQQLTVGTIEELRKTENEIFQQAFVKPARDPRYLREVFVIRTPNTE